MHVQRNARTDLTSRPGLQAGRELKRLSDRLTSVETAGQAVRWGEALNAWHERWKDFIAERTYARDDPSNPKASRHRWWWTHEELRRCYRRLERLFREGRLFAYLEPELLKGVPVAVLLQCLFDRFGSVFPQCGLMVFPGVVIVSR